MPQSCAQAAPITGGPPAIGAHVIQGGQMIITVAQPAAIELQPEEGSDNDEADLLQPDENKEDTQKDEEEVQQNKEEEIEDISVDLLEEYSDTDANDEVSSIPK